MIAIDVTPLVLGPSRGVARAQAELLRGLSRLERPQGIALFAPGPLPPGVETLDGVVSLPARSARAFRRRLPSLLRRNGARVLLSPWAAFPRTPVPVVVVLHEIPFVRHGAIEGRLRAWRHQRWLDRDARAAAVIVPSEATRDDVLATKRIPADRLHVVPHAFDPSPWEEARRAVGGGGPDLVMIGTGTTGGRKKGLDVLVAALRGLAARRLDVAVVGTLPRHARRAGLREVRHPPDDVLRPLVASARALVHPALSEGFGFPLLEAMAAGVPVVASRAGSLPEVAGESALLVPPGDATALAEALARVLDDEALRARLVDAGRHRARAFPPERAARAVLDVLQRALA